MAGDCGATVQRVPPASPLFHPPPRFDRYQEPAYRARMFARLFRLIAMLFLAGFVLRLVLSLFRPIPSRRGSTAKPAAAAGAERLVQDPVCRVRLPESRALIVGGQHFCSRECADQFRLSAHG